MTHENVPDDELVHIHNLVRARLRHPSVAGTVAIAARRYAETHPAQVAVGHREKRGARILMRSAIGGIAITSLVFAAVLIRDNNEPEERPHTYATQAGQMATIQLRSGTSIVLAPESSVDVSGNGVTVTGEAYFTVAPDEKRAFVAYTGQAAVTVLGTRFAMRRYPGEAVTRVVVEEGKVSLARRAVPKESAVVLSAEMVGNVSDSNTTVTSGISPQKYTAWTRGMLVFDGVPLRHVMAELGRVYGADIRITDTMLAAKPLVLEVSVQTQSLTQVLGLIGLTMDAHYRQTGRAYLLLPGRAAGMRLQREFLHQSEKRYGL